MNRTKQLVLLCALTMTFGLSRVAPAQVNQQRRLITQPVNNTQLVTFGGNTRPEAVPDNDMGAASAATALPGLELVLQRPAEAQAAFDKFVADAHDPKSASYHQWLTNAQIGALYGPSTEDIAAIKSWLSSQGFTVGSATPDGMVIEFSGTVGKVNAAFHTSMHNLNVNGQAHLANMSDPSMPAALAPAVAGVAKLNDFMPHGMAQARLNAAAKAKGAKGVLTNGFISFLGSADLAAIYNFNPLFKAGITGKGQTIVVIEDTDQYSINDWSVFRKTFGLARAYPFGTLVNSHPAGTLTCTAPGTNGDDGEAAIDSQWASSAAPNAAIINAACGGRGQFGGFVALTNLLQQAGHPTIVSISYGEAEASNGATENLFISNLYQTAVAEGVSIFVSSGDEGAASADANRTVSTHGIGVSGYTSTPYNISVGGTDFGYLPLGTPGTYFNTTNGPSFQTAIGYISEIPWNDSCAGALLAAVEGAPTTGANSVCNDTADFGTSLRTTASGSGGPSGCATGTVATGSANRGVVSGTCAGYAKPSWQNVLGVPADGVRDIPDVSLMASNGFWGTYYDVCWSDPTQTQGGSAPCVADPSQWAGFGGTSISSPIWAGIQALVNQDTNASWGNSNTVLYSLANTEYGSTGKASCNSSLGNAVGTDCVFYDVTQGDMAVNCTGTNNCFGWVAAGTGGMPPALQGVLSTSNSTDSPAYGTNVGWDFPSGIGTTNATNLVNAWKAYAAAHPPAQ
jgi:subtilase family serine protease